MARAEDQRTRVPGLPGGEDALHDVVYVHHVAQHRPVPADVDAFAVPGRPHQPGMKLSFSAIPGP